MYETVKTAFPVLERGCSSGSTCGLLLMHHVLTAINAILFVVGLEIVEISAKSLAVECVNTGEGVEDDMNYTKESEAAMIMYLLFRQHSCVIRRNASKLVGKSTVMFKDLILCGIRQNSSISKLVVDETCTETDMSDMAQVTVGMMDLHRAIEHLRNLRIVNINITTMSEAFTNHLLRWISEFQIGLEELSYETDFVDLRSVQAMLERPGCALKSLYFTGGIIEADFLRAMTSIRRLKLIGASFQNEAVVELARLLMKTNCMIETLELNFTNLNDDTASYLAEAVAHNRSLIEINLRDNIALSTRSLRVLIEALSINKSLQVMRLGDVTDFGELAQLAIDRGQCQRLHLAVLCNSRINVELLAQFKYVTIEHGMSREVHQYLGETFDALRASPHVQHVYIFSNFLNSVAEKVAAFIADSKTLKTLGHVWTRTPVGRKDGFGRLIGKPRTRIVRMVEVCRRELGSPAKSLQSFQKQRDVD